MRTIFYMLILIIIYLMQINALPTVNTETTDLKTVNNRTKRYILFSKHPLHYLRTWNYTVQNDTSTCIDSADDFPNFFSITETQLENGAIIINFLIGIYCFILLAIICDSYFLPCMERICESLNLSQDVAAATFMSIATSTPELFVNIIGTFVTESDIGVGTVVGSSLFNTLGVASAGGLAASMPLQLHWWPLTRDVIIYISAILLLVSISWDGVVEWYEALILFLAYFIYFTVMFQNARISACIKRAFGRRRVADSKPPPSASTAVGVAVVSSNYGSYLEEPVGAAKEAETVAGAKAPAAAERGGGALRAAFHVLTFPIRFVLFCTIPDPKKYPKLFPVTFVLCIIFMGTNSYVVSWMIAIIGRTFRIPDAVLGLTFLAAGGCLPEAISITIMSRRGEGSMGVSNSLGANTMNILMSLGLPWFLKTIAKGTASPIVIDSKSLKYTILGLVPVACTLYLTLYLHKFRLSKRVGVVLISIYMVVVVFAIILEMMHSCYA